MSCWLLPNVQKPPYSCLFLFYSASLQHLRFHHIPSVFLVVSFPEYFISQLAFIDSKDDSEYKRYTDLTLSAPTCQTSRSPTTPSSTPWVDGTWPLLTCSSRVMQSPQFTFLVGKDRTPIKIHAGVVEGLSHPLYAMINNGQMKESVSQIAELAATGGRGCFGHGARLAAGRDALNGRAWSGRGQGRARVALQPTQFCL